jgi:hypothetical protein
MDVLMVGNTFIVTRHLDGLVPRIPTLPVECPEIQQSLRLPHILQMINGRPWSRWRLRRENVGKPETYVIPTIPGKKQLLLLYLRRYRRRRWW